ncbi:iron uptake system protein EfeO [Sinomonas sp. R1AF57]|uniref:iron uptake system protein EfeO n=1 Tax=Sinomonas sp. R1AF57 TaxID=2020377 RepID=UPI000B60C2CD|nr:iron uptake system protein EfeO [Sinomonas sp. R1AF57]ASN52777.1 PbrT family lead (Pb2+) uptake porter [Sinomonas sp. R1AF57]
MPSTAQPAARRRARHTALRTAALATAVAATLALAACGGDTTASPAASPSATKALDTETAALLEKGEGTFTAFIKAESERLLEGTKAFAAEFEEGDADKARALYASTRMHWERIEPAAEKFTEFDAKLDTREADLEPGEEWTGWHRAEKDLFPPAGYTAMTKAEREKIADALVADTEGLHRNIETVTFESAELGAGAKELLDEVARGKVTGEEEAFSHTDLWDFRANVDGAKAAYEALRPALARTDAALVADLDAKFAAVDSGLAKHAAGEGFVAYTDLTPAQVHELAGLVDALGEPLSKLTAAVAA